MADTPTSLLAGIPRYDLEDYGGYYKYPHLVESDGGEWCKWADLAPLLRRVEELGAAIERLRKDKADQRAMHGFAEADVRRLTAENAELREQIDVLRDLLTRACARREDGEV